jgi:hypothetical protein
VLSRRSTKKPRGYAGDGVAVGAKTKRIEIGTAVVDMRFENPLYVAEDAGVVDIIAGARLQLVLPSV